MKKIFILITGVIILSGSGCSVLQEQTQKNTDNSQLKETETNSPIVGATLNLSDKQLDKIPSYVLNQTNLEELDLSNNQITGALPAEIRQLKKLKVLKANNNLMTGVPAEIGQLENLQTLDLSNNKLTGLPYELGNLKNLKILNISGNNYSELDLNIIQEKLPSNLQIIK